MIKKLFIPFVALLLIATTSCKKPKYDIEDGLYAEIITTKGTMVAKLHYDKVPVTVANFVALSEGNHPLAEEKYKGKPFYDGVTFHRVMNNFMIQGGDPTGTGRGTPGYKFAADFSKELKHDKPGILSMANSGGINTNGSQFFITERPYPRGDFYDAQGNLKPCDQRGISCHSVFGELVIGLEVQDSISNVKVINPSARNNKPVEDVLINKVNIIRIGRDAKKFDAPKVFEENMPKVVETFNEIRQEAAKKEEEKQRLIEEQKKKVAADFKSTLDDYKSKAKTLPSGLRIYNIVKGNGTKPKTGEVALINYQAYFTDGILLDSNVKEVEEKYGMLNPQKVQRDMYSPAPMKISPDASLVAGFKEALAMMRVGEKSYFYMPSHLAYGESGRPPVKPNTDLAFIIEMVDMQK